MRIALTRLVAVAAVAAIPVLGATSTAGAASSVASIDTDCPHNGYITNGDTCTVLSNGVLYLHDVPNGSYVQLAYSKTGGSAISAKLGYERNSTNHYGSYKSMSSGNEYWQTFSPSAVSCAVDIGLIYDSGSGSQFQTPPTKDC
ncbi:hypothetical protein ABTY98_42065 [Streptomyces sp. NPDC096040]|uniref:hypothetical protein n=1 Tax=Streptomyces sp. NPDC096040 TaxID=3155541 RepID=UPI00332E0F2B